MSDEKVVALVKRDDPLHVIKHLEELLAKAKAGEIEEFIAVIVRPDRTFSSVGSGTKSILEQIGMLQTMIIDILKASWKGPDPWTGA